MHCRVRLWELISHELHQPGYQRAGIPMLLLNPLQHAAHYVWPTSEGQQNHKLKHGVANAWRALTCHASCRSRTASLCNNIVLSALSAKAFSSESLSARSQRGQGSRGKLPALIRSDSLDSFLMLFGDWQHPVIAILLSASPMFQERGGVKCALPRPPLTCRSIVALLAC